VEVNVINMLSVYQADK